MTRRIMLVVYGVLLFSSTLPAGELHVLPVVADQVPGRNDSLWDTEVRIFSLLEPGEDLVVRRVWVCLEGGGFEDDPETAPVWRLSDDAYHEDYPWSDVTFETRRLIVLDGASLLQGTDSNVGAVGLEIEGGAVVVGRITNVAGEDVESWDNLQRHFQLLGLGQLVSGQTTPLNGPSVFPWLTPDTGGAYTDCTSSTPCNWRNNLGLVNPSSQTLTLTLNVLSYVGVPYYGDEGQCEPGEDNRICPGVAGEIYDRGESKWDEYEVVLPPWGWVQINNVDYMFLLSFPGGWPTPINGWSSILALNILPEDDERPYYAYLSQVFSGAHNQNDPAFITPIPGQFRSVFDEPPKVGEIEEGNAQTQ